MATLTGWQRRYRAAGEHRADPVGQGCSSRETFTDFVAATACKQSAHSLVSMYLRAGRNSIRVRALEDDPQISQGTGGGTDWQQLFGVTSASAERFTGGWKR